MNNLMSRVNNWTSGQRTAGRNGLCLIHDVAEHMIETGDWTPASRLIKRTEEHSSGDASRIKFLLGHSVAGVKLKKDEKHPEGYRFMAAQKGASFNDSVKRGNGAGVIAAYIEQEATFRSKDLYAELRGEKAEAQFDLDKYAKRVKTKLESEGVDINALFAVIKQL